MGVCTFFDKSMKVLSSILAMATAQWDGFNYDDYSDVGKNQASQVSVNDVLNMNGASGQTAANYAANNHYLGNGLKCFYCNERSVSACFTRSTFSVCQGQEYFCFFHERRKISHFFNRREKYIDNFASGNTDVFLARSANEAFNLASGGLVTSDRDAPQTLVHVMAGCQQPQACLRQQSQNNPITIGVKFYGNPGDLIQQNENALPTSRRNVREGLCRLGKDWTYYSGHHWYYDDNGQTANSSPNTRAHELTAAQADGHQFYDERESWYNGMRPNGFPQERHGGKGTESVCHFCCNPVVDGNYCNREYLDDTASASQDADFIYSTGTRGSWYNGNADLANSVRADNEGLSYNNTPLRNGWDLANAGWSSNQRYHGMWRNPETQVAQNWVAGTGR